MNAAYLLLTSAWLAGAEPAQAAAPAATPVVSTSTGSCSGGCGGCADACKPSLCDRLKSLGARMRRGNNCGCEAAPTCCAPAPVCKPAPAPCCAPAKPVRVHCCAPAPSCGCDDPCAKKASLLDRLRARFKKNDCCESSCGCGSATAPGSAEPIQAQPKTGDAKPMPKTTTPMTLNGVISNVTPVMAPSSPF